MSDKNKKFIDSHVEFIGFEEVGIDKPKEKLEKLLDEDIIKKQQKKIYILERECKRLIDEKSDNDVVMTLSKIEELTDKQMEQVFLIINTLASLQPGFSSTGPYKVENNISSILGKCYKELESLNG
mgnify:CR=1 FL=1